MYKVKMFPGIKAFRNDESGIKRVIEAYIRLLPDYGFEIVPEDSATYDLTASHAGAMINADVVHCHGLYWSEEYDSAKWELNVNAYVIASIRQARSVTVPSRWVAETFQRDMRFTPYVVPHGIDAAEWEHSYDPEYYVLWNKNRNADVCNPYAVGVLAKARTDMNFVSTFKPPDFQGKNVEEIGVVAHDVMKGIIQRSFIYLSTTKETFGIGVLEAMASGVPVLGVRWGGNVDLVEHGVSGYLAEPGNEEDLIAGLDYCIKYRKELGENARELVKKWTWERAIEKLANVYKMSIFDIKPSVSVVIPSYNYADKVEGAIRSAADQTYKPSQIIVVDDGSDDDTESVVARVTEDVREHGINVTYIRQVNSGVAVARNRGIAETGTKYICCLDADDRIKPDFLKVCVDALEQDRSLGIAYTSLEYVTPDGNTGVSNWPGEFNYDEQLQGKNQIPTCCVFRYKMWERLGGYRQRYAPEGAGAEDAEFWLRAGAYGFNAKKVTSKALFTYSWKSGRVSGDPNYKEVDWRVFHPWTKDDRHPFASVATPKNGFSHWVRSYDRPTVSVVIPVSASHIKEVPNALDSLEAQDERQWEAIIVDDTGDGEGSDLLKDIISKTYPYVKYVVPYHSGAGAARNAGALAARGMFLLFLDADDWLYPEALGAMLDVWEETGNIVYSDYVGKAYIDAENANKLGERLLHYNTKTGEAVVRHYSFDYECERALRQPDKRDMYIWNLITSLVPRVWHEQIGGFDENMSSWEDWDYWIRMARAGKCFTRIEKPLVVYRFYTGSRREAGLQAHESLVEYMTSKLEQGELPMPCGCRGNKRATPLQRATQTVTPATVMREQGVSSMQDENMVLCVYTSPNAGQHRVVGAQTNTNYGYRGGGEVFYVHKADVAVAPHLFRPVEETKPEVKKPPVPPPAPPNAEPEPAAPPLPKPMTSQPEEVEESSAIEILELDHVPGVTPDIASALRAMGISTVEELGELDIDTLLSIKGVGEKRATSIVEALKEFK